MGPTSAAPVTKPSFPVIDFASALSGDAAQKQRVGRAIIEGCKGAGFFYLAGHGIAQSELDGIFAAAHRFFSQPLEERMKLSGPGLRGYRQYGFYSRPDSERMPDLMEHFVFQRELPADDPDVLAGDRLHGLNKWPADLPGWREDVLGYFRAVEKLSFQILGVMALALDVEEDYFLPFFHKPTSTAKVFHYPPQPPATAARQVGLGAHFDDGALTLLLQDEVGGLQVECPEGWIFVDPVPGTFVINIGEIMARWTNDLLVPTPHRVLNRTGRERYSIPFFSSPDWDAVIAPLPTCIGPARPQKYPARRAAFFQSRGFRDANWKARHAARKAASGRGAAAPAAGAATPLRSA